MKGANPDIIDVHVHVIEYDYTYSFHYFPKATSVL